MTFEPNASSWPFDTRPFPDLDAETRAAAKARQGQLTKPPGSLGRLEEMAITMASVQGTAAPSARPCSVLLFAADHPVTAHGVSPYPSSVTAAMVKNFEAGGAAASVMCAHLSLPLVVIDAGVFGGPTDAEVPEGDLRVEDALSPEAYASCLRAGSEAAKRHAEGNRVTIFGEMGIGNTTAAAAVCAALIEPQAAEGFVGAGTGAQGPVLETKRAVVGEAVRRLEGERDPHSILRRVGGREMAQMLGAMRTVLERRSLILVDGFIVSAVAAVLCALEEGARSRLLFAHRSGEQAHGRVLEHLQAQPLLDLEMRLGEASGALAAFPLLEACCELHNRMATFESANLAGAER